MPKTGTVPASTDLKPLFRASVPMDFRWLSVVNRSGSSRTLDLYFQPRGGVAVPICEGAVVLNDGDRALEEQPRQLEAGDEIQGKADGGTVTFELEVVTR